MNGGSFRNYTANILFVCTLRPINDATEGSMQEAHMGATCVLSSVTPLTGRAVLILIVKRSEFS